MKLLIGIPSGGQPTPPFLEALARLQLPPTVDEVDRLVWSGNFVAAQREMLLRAALRDKVDLLAMIDDDIVAPPDALEKLVGALVDDPAIAVAGALYYSRDGARPMVVSRWDPHDTTTAAIPPYGNGPAIVDGVGFGLVVLRVGALRALQAPYFAAHLYVDETARRVTQCDEDYLLCARLREAGWQVVVHAGVRAGHFDRGAQSVAPAQWETAAETDRLRMIVQRSDGVHLVPFDDAVGRVREVQEPFPTTLLRVGETT